MHNHNTTRVLLLGLHSLLTFYLPALLVLGVHVRELTWMGGLGGTVRGDTARFVLESCLALQVHLMADWQCKKEYTRSLAVALLTWQPWYSRLPGCCFCEEPCEALLSRMVARCRYQRQLTSFEQLLHLFVTLPAPSKTARGTRGGLRKEMVMTVVSRVVKLLRDGDSMPYARLVTATSGYWEETFPEDCLLPIPPDREAASRSLQGVLRAALITLTRRRPLPADVVQVADLVLPLRDAGGGRDPLQLPLSRIDSWVRGEDVPVNLPAAPPPGEGDMDVGSGDEAESLYFPPEPSDGASLYMPSGSVGDSAVVDGGESWPSRSYGDTSSVVTLGSIAEVVAGRDGNWDDVGDQQMLDDL